jgi:CheY-like chemotaxis protein
MSGNGTLEGRRILVVEDEAMIAMLVEDMLGDLGCIVVGPAYNLDSALAMAGDSTPLDAAVLDVNLAGRPSFEVADALKARGVPAIFSTGYGHGGLRASDNGAAVLQKPFRVEDLVSALHQALGTSREGANS